MLCRQHSFLCCCVPLSHPYESNQILEYSSNFNCLNRHCLHSCSSLCLHTAQLVFVSLSRSLSNSNTNKNLRNCWTRMPNCFCFGVFINVIPCKNVSWKYMTNSLDSCMWKSRREREREMMSASFEFLYSTIKLYNPLWYAAERSQQKAWTRHAFVKNWIFIEMKVCEPTVPRALYTLRVYEWIE